VNGKEKQNCEGGEAGEVSDSPGESLQDLWPQPGLYAEVRHLPHLLPGTCIAGTTPWRDEVELVILLMGVQGVTE